MEPFNNESKAFKIMSFSWFERFTFFSSVMETCIILTLRLLWNVANAILWGFFVFFLQLSSHSRRMFLSFTVRLRRMRHQLASTSGLEPPLFVYSRGLSFRPLSPFLSPHQSVFVCLLHSRHNIESDFTAGSWRQHICTGRAMWRNIPVTMFVVPRKEIFNRRYCFLMS